MPSSSRISPFPRIQGSTQIASTQETRSNATEGTVVYYLEQHKQLLLTEPSPPLSLSFFSSIIHRRSIPHQPQQQERSPPISYQRASHRTSGIQQLASSTAQPHLTPAKLNQEEEASEGNKRPKSGVTRAVKTEIERKQIRKASMAPSMMGRVNKKKGRHRQLPETDK